MKTIQVTIILLIVFTVSAFSQKADDSKAAVAVVNELFAQMRAANAAGILATGTAENQLVAVRKLKDGKSKVEVINGEQFTKFFTKPGSIEELMYDPKVEVSGDWAMVWGRYVFFVGEKVNHCGINQFNLVRIDGAWKIANGASTIDPGDCSEKEKAMKPVATKAAN